MKADQQRRDLIDLIDDAAKRIREGKPMSEILTMLETATNEAESIEQQER